jgi:hypothetical protein
MERCPKCGTPAREGAKFCTTCGHRIANGVEVGATGDDPGEIAAGVDNPLESPTTDDTNSGWPAAPSSEGAAPLAAPADRSWRAEPDPTTTAADPDAEALADSAWPDPPAASWPTAPQPVMASADSWQPPEAEVPPPEPETADVVGDPTETDTALRRAERLAADLHETLANIGRTPSVDLTGVISELEVAVTPPGALVADELAELRDALLAARDRPRDVDTIVDLTRRVDAMVALVIAYDRTVAAIERSLEVLRRT